MLFRHAELSLAEREKALQKEATKTESRQYARTVDHAEIAMEEKRYANNAIEVNTLSTKMKNTVEEYKGKIKGLEEKMVEQLEVIRSGKRDVTGTLYGVPDYKAGMMSFYSANGELISSRELLDQERQADMFKGGKGDKPKPAPFEGKEDAPKKREEGITPHEDVTDTNVGDKKGKKPTAKEKADAAKNFGASFEAGGATDVKVGDVDPALIHAAAAKGDEGAEDKKTTTKK